MSASSDPNIELEQDDPEQLLYNDFLAFVKLVYRYDKRDGNDPSKKLVKYVKLIPNHGIQKGMADFRTQLESVYTENKADILEGFDDYILKPKPLLLRVNGKIYLAVGGIYNRLNEKQQDEIHAALTRVFIHFATTPEEKLKLTALAGEKEKTGGGGGGLGDILSGMLGGEGGEGIGSLLNDIAGQLKGAAADPNNPDSIDTNKIGDIVKNLINDKSKDGFFAKMANNPAIGKLSEKLQKDFNGGAK